MPCRPILQQLISSHSSDSENPTSTRAQVGLQRPDVPPSQTEENKAWREFVVGADQRHALGELQSSHSQEPPEQGEISPGVSQLGLPGRGKGRGRSEEVRPPQWKVESSTEQTQPSVNLLQRSPSEVSSTCKTAQDKCSSTSNRSRLTSPERHLPRSDQHTDASDDKMHKRPVNPAERLDEVSLLVVPGSSIASSEDILSRFDNVAILEKQETMRRAQQALPQAEQHQAQQPLKPARARYQSSRTGQDAPSKPDTLAAANDMWRSFVLGWSNDNLEDAYEEARKETARNLLPSDVSASTDEDDTRETTSPRADHVEAFVTSGGSLLADDAPESVEGHDQSSAGVSVASVSHRAIAGYSSPDPLSELNPPYSETTIRTGRATNGSLSPATDGSSKLVDGLSHPNEARSFATREVKNASHSSNPPLLDVQNRENDSFKFARPKPFMGKQVSHIDEQQQIALSAPQVRGKPQTRRRQKKRTGDGRTRIRKLPDFSSDPIEEVDEEIRTKGGQKPSLFGSLDVQNQF